MTGPAVSHPPTHRIEMHLGAVSQLFNSLDPSPFHEKDLDADAEEFLVSWAQEFPVRDPISLVVHLEGDENPETAQLVQRAVRNYFDYRAGITRRDLSRLFRQGQVSLVIGLLFLLACFGAREMMGALGEGALASFAREGVIIAGWVAMWRPMEIYLYDWWPLRRRGRIFEKLSSMPVSVRHRGQSADVQIGPHPSAAGG